MMQTIDPPSRAVLAATSERLAIVRNRKTAPDPYRVELPLDAYEIEEDDALAEQPPPEELHVAACCRLGVAGYLVFAAVACAAPEPGDTQGGVERAESDPIASGGLRLQVGGLVSRASATTCVATGPGEPLRSEDPSLEAREVARRALAAARVELLQAASLRLEGLDADVAALRGRLEPRMGPADTAAIIAGLEAHSHVVRRYNAFDVARASAETMELVRHGVEARTEGFELAILDADGS